MVISDEGDGLWLCYTNITSVTATCLGLTILVLTMVKISNSSARVLDIPDMFQLQALHPLAYGTKEKEEHGHPWLSVSATVAIAITYNHLQRPYPGFPVWCPPSSPALQLRGRNAQQTINNAPR